jgi:hypothetical protein
VLQTSSPKLHAPDHAQRVATTVRRWHRCCGFAAVRSRPHAMNVSRTTDMKGHHITAGHIFKVNGDGSKYSSAKQEYTHEAA